MFNLTDPNLSYMIISPEKNAYTQMDNRLVCERVCSILYSKDYTIIPIKSFSNGQYDNSFIAINMYDNDNLRKDAIFIMDSFNCQSVIAKYKNESSMSKIINDGSERPLMMNVYDNDLNHKMYLYNGYSFTFVEQKRYFFPKQKGDLKSGMIVEFFNNEKWIKKEIWNVDSEYDKMYKLLMKYEKLRVECK